MDDLKTAFRGVMLRDIRPIEDKDGVRVGEDVRITRETEKEKGKDGGATYYLVRYLKDTKESRRKQVRHAVILGSDHHVSVTRGIKPASERRWQAFQVLRLESQQGCLLRTRIRVEVKSKPESRLASGWRQCLRTVSP